MIIFKSGERYGDWTLDAPLGEGGNGVVWRATSSDSTIAAIKFLSPWIDDLGQAFYEPKRYKRFRDEIHAFSGCQDIPGVLPLLDSYVPELDIPELTDPPWLVLALAIPLEDALGESPDLQQIVTACSSFADTLAEMHSRGFSHRDIKPDNLFNYKGKWCLGDFGLATFRGKLAETSTGERLGPRFYIADEMLNNPRDADGSLADVYSLAKTLWKLGTGQAYPLQGTIFATEESMRLSTYSNNKRSFLLDPLLEHATKHDPRQRITMAALSSELSAWVNPSEPREYSETSLRHFVTRLHSIQGDFKSRQQQIQASNNSVEQSIRKFLGEFNQTLANIANDFRELNIDCTHTIAQQGRHHVWLAHYGNQNSQGKGVYYYQNDLTATLRRPMTQLFVTIITGICLRISVEHSLYGQRYFINGSVPAVAATSINKTTSLLEQECIASSGIEFVLEGPQEASIIDDFRSLIEKSVSLAMEQAIAYLETNIIS